jgi:chaperonin GroES
MDEIKFKPVSDRMIIDPIPVDSITASGLIIPENAKEKPQKGTVIAVGPGTKDDKMEVKVGDVVLYGKHAGTEINLEGKDYLIMRQSDLLVIL